MNARLQRIMDLKEAYEDTLRKEAIAAFKEEFTSFFDSLPEVEAVRWRQYTPYFNDGSPCEFAVHGMNVRLRDVECADSDYDDGFFSTYGFQLPAHIRAAVKKLEEIDESIFLACFGDHSLVTATRNGFAVEEYSHD